MMMWNGAPWWHWLSMAGVWIAGVAVIVWAISSMFPDQPHRDAQQILDERFARGEVDVEEYRQRGDELHAHPRSKDRPGA